MDMWESRLNNDTGSFSDVSVLSCVQCQHQCVYSNMFFALLR